MDTWKDEIQKHTRPGGLKVMCWYGGHRSQVSLDVWKSADIVITTPATLLHDTRAPGGATRLPFTTTWYRVVIDEAQ